MITFERDKHVYRSDEFEELIKDTIRFFNGTPVHTLPPPEKFHGTGVYAIYYIGKFPKYKKLYEKNRTSFDLPIYIGKAVPTGWRQARTISLEGKITFVKETRGHISPIVKFDNKEIIEPLTCEIWGQTSTGCPRMFFDLKSWKKGFQKHTYNR